MAQEEDDESSLNEAAEELKGLEEILEKLEFSRMFSKEHDECDCYMDIQSGSGGTEAQDWASMILRMYYRDLRGRGCRNQVRHDQIHREIRLWLAQDRDRRSPPREEVAV